MNFRKHFWNRNNQSLRRLTFILLIVMLLLFFIAFLASSFIMVRKTEDDFRIRSSETAVNNVVLSIDSGMDNFNYISRLIMVNQNVVNFLKAKEANKSISYEARMGMYEILNMYSTIRQIESVYVFRNDKEYAHTGKGEYEIDFDCEAWEEILSVRGAKVISLDGNGLIRRMDQKSNLTFSRAIYDINSQKCLGVLVMNLSSSSFDQALSLQKTSGMCILDENGVYLSGDSNLAGLWDKSCNSQELVSRTIRFNGHTAAFAAKRSNSPLVVICCVESGMDRIPMEITSAMLLTMAAFLISILSTTVFIRHNITKPVRSLNQAMERTRSSGWLERIDEKMPNNELGHLAESYNSMIDYLNVLFERLKNEEEEMRKAEMRVLQEQIKPHFLYNTLETISYLAIENQMDMVHDALETLGSFYRNFLSKGEREIPFRRELHITQDYLTLQKLRYGESFSDEYQIDEDTLDCMIPKLILQPLVENCIYHGVRLKGELCIIRISAHRQEDGLHILVYDSGVGMDEKTIKEVLMSGTEAKDAGLSRKPGFGLAGTLDRIRYYCNKDDIVQIRSEEGEYTEIELVIPDKSEDPGVKSL